MTVTVHATTGAGTANTWANPANAAADDNVYATHTPARDVVNTSYWAIDPFTEILAEETVISVTIGVRIFAGGADTSGVIARALMNGTTVVGTATPSGNTAIPGSEALITATVSGVTAAQLQAATLQVRTATTSSDSGPGQQSIDYIYVQVEHLVPVEHSTEGAYNADAMSAMGSF